MPRFSTTTPEVAIYAWAHYYHVDGGQLYLTLKCESNFDPKTQSTVLDPTGPNGREDSWGIAQIHLPDWPEVTRQQAQDPDYAISWIAKRFALGDANKWTCYRLAIPTRSPKLSS